MIIMARYFSIGIEPLLGSVVLSICYSSLFSANEKYCSSARMMWSRRVMRTDSAALVSLAAMMLSNLVGEGFPLTWLWTVTM